MKLNHLCISKPAPKHENGGGGPMSHTIEQSVAPALVCKQTPAFSRGFYIASGKYLHLLQIPMKGSFFFF